MANVLIDERTMSEIGNAIRSKTGKTDLILPANMPSEIEGISVGGDDNFAHGSFIGDGKTYVIIEDAQITSRDDILIYTTDSVPANSCVTLFVTLGGANMIMSKGGSINTVGSGNNAFSVGSWGKTNEDGKYSISLYDYETNIFAKGVKYNYRLYR